jgi:hypothetical protein
VNVLALHSMSMKDIVEGGAKRISIGSGLTWVAAGAMAKAAQAMLHEGDLSVLRADVKVWEFL